MLRTGAEIAIDGRQAVVRGPSPLGGTGVIASDLRASASLVLTVRMANGNGFLNGFNVVRAGGRAR